MVATGSADGSLAVWDLRQEKMPVGLIAAHQSIGELDVSCVCGGRGCTAVPHGGVEGVPHGGGRGCTAVPHGDGRVYSCTTQGW